MELIRSLHQKHTCHCTSERESLNTDLVTINVRQSLQPLSPCAEILYLPHSQLTVYHVKTFTSVVTCSSWIHSNLDNAVLRIPLIRRCWHNPSVTHHRRVRSAIDIHMHRIFLCCIETFRIHDHRRKLEPVFCCHEHKLTKRIFRWIIVFSLGICDNITLTDILSRGGKDCYMIWSRHIRQVCDKVLSVR